MAIATFIKGVGRLTPAQLQRFEQQHDKVAAFMTLAPPPSLADGDEKQDGEEGSDVIRKELEEDQPYPKDLEDWAKLNWHDPTVMDRLTVRCGLLIFQEQYAKARELLKPFMRQLKALPFSFSSSSPYYSQDSAGEIR